MAAQGDIFMPNIRLEARNLGMRRGYRRLFEGLNLVLDPGRITQLVGPNGTGKSTLIRILAGFLKADSGQVLWHGLTEEQEGHALLHYHGHREGLREALTPHENLMFSAQLLGGDVARVLTALDRLGIPRLADLPVQVLSAGQRRRVALARLLVAPRPLWLLDEPLAALDVAGQALVSALLAEHAAQGGMALVATHQPLGIETQVLDLAVASGLKRENAA